MKSTCPEDSILAKGPGTVKETTSESIIEILGPERLGTRRVFSGERGKLAARTQGRSVGSPRGESVLPRTLLGIAAQNPREGDVPAELQARCS